MLSQRSTVRSFCLACLASACALAAAPVSVTSPSSMGTYPIGEVQAALTAAGGDGVYAWGFVSGTLPTGLNLRTDVPATFPIGSTAGIIGVATTPGTYNFALSVTSGGSSVTQAFSMKITGLTLKDLPTLPVGFVGQPYSYTLTAQGGGSAAFTPTSPLPPGLALSSAGVVSGTPSAAGTSTINFSFTDGVDTVFRSVSLSVSAIRFTSAGMLANATAGSSYGAAVVAAGGSGIFTYTTAGGLPPGLSLSLSGAISGTVSSGSGKHNFTVTATDSTGKSFTKHFAIDVIGVPAVLPAISIGGFAYKFPTIGFPFSRMLTVYAGGKAPFTWSVSGLPSGVSARDYDHSERTDMAPGDVEIWGTPTVTGVFTVQATVTGVDGVSSTTAFPLNVEALGVDLADFPGNGTVGTSYSKKLRVLGGTAPYTINLFNTLNLPLPAGVSLHTSTFVVSGTPVESGEFAPVITFEDSADHIVDILPTFTISGGASTVVVNQGSNLGTNPIGTPYALQLTACCTPSSSFNWTIYSGTTPPGIGLSSGGLLNGTPTTAGTYTFVVQATDTTNPANVGRRQFETIATPMNYAASLTLPDATVGLLYSASLASGITGATGAVTAILQPGSFLPPGVLMSESGVMNGAPTATGRFFIFVEFSDTASHTLRRTFVLDVFPPPVFMTMTSSPTGLPITIDGVAFTTPKVVGWIPGTTHTVLAPAVVVSGGTRHTFSAWSPGGSTALLTLTAPTTGATYTASFTTEHQLTTKTSPSIGGSITASGWKAAGSTVSVQATAADGYKLAYFSGDLAGSTNPQYLVMNGPRTVVANFQSTATPALSAAVTGKTSGGTLGQRVWTFRLSNAGPGTATSAQITGVTIKQTAGTTCSPTVVTTLPVSYGTIAAAANATGQVTFNFLSCTDTASRFSLKVEFSANGGAYSGSTTISNQTK